MSKIQDVGIWQTIYLYIWVKHKLQKQRMKYYSKKYLHSCQEKISNNQAIQWLINDDSYSHMEMKKAYKLTGFFF